MLPLWNTESPSWKSLLRFGDKVRNNSSDHDPALNVPLKTLVLVSFFSAVYCFARAYVLLEDFVNLRSLRIPDGKQHYFFQHGEQTGPKGSRD